nr:uncharacterized protein At1g76660-like [Ipomoea batatas]
MPFASSKPQEKNIMIVSTDEVTKVEKSRKNVSSPQYLKSSSYHAKGPYSNIADHSLQKHSKDFLGQNALSNHAVSDDEDVFSKMGNSRHGRKHPPGLSSSDAEIDYRKGRTIDFISLRWVTHLRNLPNRRQLLSRNSLKIRLVSRGFLCCDADDYKNRHPLRRKFRQFPASTHSNQSGQLPGVNQSQVSSSQRPPPAAASGSNGAVVTSVVAVGDVRITIEHL